MLAKLLKSVLTATIVLTFVSQTQAADPAQPSDDELTRWETTYVGLKEMNPKWGVQGPDAFKASTDAGVPIFYLDVRTPQEWKGGIVEGATLVSLSALPTAEGRAALPQDKNTIIGVCCKSGHRSTLALTLLHQLGYKNVVSMSGGFEAWKGAQHTIVDGPQ